MSAALEISCRVVSSQAVGSHAWSKSASFDQILSVLDMEPLNGCCVRNRQALKRLKWVTDVGRNADIGVPYIVD